MAEKTHYRKAFDSPYLSSADIVDATILTVQRVALEPDRTKKTKDLFNTAHFLEKELRPGEKLKPMILNASNSKTLRGITGSPFLDDWRDIQIVVYVDSNVRFGKEIVEGLRIQRVPERVAKQPISDARFVKAMESITEGKFTADKLRSGFALSEAQEARLKEAASESTV